MKVNLAYRAYSMLSSGIFLSLFPPFWFYSRLTGRYRDSIDQRIGIYPREVIDSISGTPRLWIHAVSVGEVSVAAAIIDSFTGLMPDCAIILSTVTEQGQAYARNNLQNRAVCLYAPLDFIGSARKALSRIRPDILICLETEIWPNLLIEAHRRGVKTAIINGRISVRSIRNYMKIRPLIAETLKHVDAFSMISVSDAQRIRRIGALPGKIEVNGNAKYDLLLLQAKSSLKAEMERLYGLKGNEPVFVAGSTRQPEEKVILDVYRKIIQSFPDALLIIAPRHVNRAPSIKELVKSRGFSCQFRTEIGEKNGARTASVIVVDTIGELLATYSIATIVFCGGSLAPLGGQNVLEAAVWGKPVFYGPSMEDFIDAKKLLEHTGGGIQVKDGRELAEKTLHFLANPQLVSQVGDLAKKAVISNQGAAKKHAEVIYRLLNN